MTSRGPNDDASERGRGTACALRRGGGLGAGVGSHLAAVPLAAAFPVGDGQCWVATGSFVRAAAWLLKGVLPIPFLSQRAKAKKQTKLVSLTIGGKTPNRE